MYNQQNQQDKMKDRFKLKILTISYKEIQYLDKDIFKNKGK